MHLDELLELTGGTVTHEGGRWVFRQGDSFIQSADGAPQYEFVKQCEETILRWWGQA